MIQVTAYQTSDGKLFTSESECQHYELSLRWRDEIDRFFKSELCPYKNNTVQYAMAQKIIVAWEGFKEIILPPETRAQDP